MDITQLLNSMSANLHFISFGLLVLSGFSLPISEDIVIILSASIASTTVPENSYIIFAACFAGAYTGDMIAYSIGKYGIKRLSKYGIFKTLFKEERIENTKKYFLKYGAVTLFVGRFFPFGVRNVLFMTSGMIEMRFVKFLIIDFCALSITSSLLFYAGYTLGNNYQVILPYLARYKYIMLLILILIIFLFFFKKRAHGEKSA